MAASGAAALPPALARVERYYTDKVLRHGATPAGVDWSCGLTQDLRFARLLQVLEGTGGPSVNDLGCGWGALLGYLRRRHRGLRVDYAGFDVSAGMVRQAQAQWPRSWHRFRTGTLPDRAADYGLASGIFNVRHGTRDAAWEALVRSTLDGLWATSRRGIAVNFIDADDPRPRPRELYRVRADRWAGELRERHGARVEVLRAYGLGEFTLLAWRAA